MAVPFLTLLCLLPSTFAAPLDQGPSQSLSLASPDTAPVHRFNLSSPNRDMGCFSEKKLWSTTNRADCEKVLDNVVAGQSLSSARLFSQNPTFGLNPVVLPYQAWHNSCLLHINVLEPNGEEIMTLAEIYAEVMGPDGLAKNCLGQNEQYGRTAAGGRLVLGRKQILSVSISGRKLPKS